jgi:hypothetical protein
MPRKQEKLRDGMVYPVLGSLKMGLTELAAASVASAFETEFISKVSSHPLATAVKDAANAARGERTSSLANVSNLRPATFWDELHDSSPASVWQLFVADREMHYDTAVPPNPDGASVFAGHLAMVNALESLLPQL